MNGKAELIFKISGNHPWSDIRDTIHKIATEFGDKYVVKFEVEKLSCEAWRPPSQSGYSMTSTVPNWPNGFATFNFAPTPEQNR